MKLNKYAVIFAGLFNCAVSQASILSDFNKSSATAEGWSIVYQGAYGTDGVDYASILNSLSAGSRVALASSSSHGASTFDLFAATSLSTLQTYTAINSTIFADGTYWYRNSSSVGFAPDAFISQNSADTVDSTSLAGLSAPDPGTGDFRLSWHTNDGAGDILTGGWRSGLTDFLNQDQIWQRYVLVQNNVPEPSSIALLGLGFAAFGISRRKKKSVK